MEMIPNQFGDLPGEFDVGAPFQLSIVLGDHLGRLAQVLKSLLRRAHLGSGVESVEPRAGKEEGTRLKLSRHEHLGGEGLACIQRKEQHCTLNSKP